MTYPEAIQFLYGLRLFGAKLGLENTLRLTALTGNPQDKLRFIHVAGTNGKGSTCAMLEGIYREEGLRVGLFTSPHLVSFRERIQVNRELIPEADVVRLVGELQLPLATFEVVNHPTFFEVVTVMALRYFAEQKCDLVIWETGLGGRLDATNIVTPLASVITNIGLDHQQWLGDTVAQIAAEKAGIIKPGVPVITATDSPEALAVIETTAKRLGSNLVRVPAAETVVAGHGDYQQLNAALALAVVETLRAQIAVSDEQIRTGLVQAHWPGRLQIIPQPGGRTLLLDGAHNLSGAEALVAALRNRFPDTRPTFILGVLGDKEWQPMGRLIASVAARVLTVPVASERTATAAELAEVCGQELPLATTACGSLPEAMEKSAGDPFVVITGSLYLVGEALELLGLGPTGGASERGLNEWGGTTATQAPLP